MTFLYGVSKFLFSALALAVALSLFASYAVAMTVVPLFCARFIKAPAHHGTPSSEKPVAIDKPVRSWSVGDRFNVWFNNRFESFLKFYDRLVGATLGRPVLTLAVFGLMFALSLGLFPLIGLSFFPRTDAGQFVINLKAPTGTRLAITEGEVAKVENLIRSIVSPEDLGMIVSNIGATPDFSAMYTTNSAMHTAFVQVSLNRGPQSGQLRIHGAGKRENRHRLAGAERVFSIRRSGRRRPESGPSGADRCPGGRLQYGKVLCHCPQAFLPDPADSRRGRRIHTAGYRLPRAAARCRPHARRRDGSRSARGGRQRDHRADLQSDDRAQFLDRSQNRQRLYADRAVSGKPGQESHRPEGHPAAWNQAPPPPPGST